MHQTLLSQRELSRVPIKTLRRSLGTRMSALGICRPFPSTLSIYSRFPQAPTLGRIHDNTESARTYTRANFFC